MSGATQSKPYAPLRLSVLEERLAVCRLDPLADLPSWAMAAPFYSVTRTPDELSVVCSEEIVPDRVTREGGWCALKLDGTFDFGQVGVLVSVAVPLAQTGVSIFAVSTFDTDYVLVKEHQLDAAVAALSERGHEVRTGGPFINIRPATGEDVAFLWEMLVEAARETSVRAVAKNPGASKYVAGWGRVGDLGSVAEADGGKLLGAAWLRLLRGEDAGYGYVDDKTPELAIAVRSGARGTGIGARLISHLLQAAEHSYRSVSLSVRSDNPALNLYERMGFQPVEGSHRTNRTGGTSVTMKLDLPRMSWNVVFERRGVMMLQLRPNCECCDKDLSPDSTDARICTFECTFCAECADNFLQGVCPNCGGELVRRPVRPASLLVKYPASSERVHMPEGCRQSA